MTETTAFEYPPGASPAEIWAILREASELNKETNEWRRETEHILKKNAEEWEEIKRLFKEVSDEQKKTAEQMKRTDKQLGGLHNSFGELAEHLVAPGIVEKFNERGHHFDGMYPKGYIISDENGKFKTEVDILLENGECMLAVEVKSRPKKKDIEHHIQRLQILREHRNKHHDQRKIQGAIAGAIFGPEIKETTLKAGMYVIEQSGDTMKIDIPDGFVPREW